MTDKNNQTQKLIKTIQSVLTPDLLKPEFSKNYDASNPLAGHCYAATEALYHMIGGKEQEFKPTRGKDDTNITHWWLQNTKGEILDPTAEQYTSVGRKPPYDNGKGGGFLTREPSKRARAIIRAVRAKSNQNTGKNAALQLKRDKQG